MKKSSIALGCVALLIAFFLGTLSAGKAPGTESESPRSDEKAALGSATLHGKIAGLGDGGVRVRLVEWVEGSDNQEQAALETDVCTLDRIERNECLPNGFFVRATGKELTLPVSADAKAVVYARTAEGGFKSDEKGDLFTEEISLADFANRLTVMAPLKETPFVVTTKYGAITEIVEQYIP